ncbi:MAG: VOC family protein [Sandaracinaceae bacterium]|nr:VOC family protein [Sandaracinaceae bacterium]
MSIQEITPYLNFDGNAATVIAHYEKVLDAKVETLMRFGDVPGMDVAKDHMGRIMHARLRIGDEGVFFKTFTKKEIANTGTHTEGIIALSYNSREEVDAIMKIVLEAGGKAVLPPVDHGFMYGASFYDLDGHHWEPFWMDPKGPPKQ